MKLASKMTERHMHHCKDLGGSSEDVKKEAYWLILGVKTSDNFTNDKTWHDTYKFLHRGEPQ